MMSLKTDHLLIAWNSIKQRQHVSEYNTKLLFYIHVITWHLNILRFQGKDKETQIQIPFTNKTVNNNFKSKIHSVQTKINVKYNINTSYTIHFKKFGFFERHCQLRHFQYGALFCSMVASFPDAWEIIYYLQASHAIWPLSCAILLTCLLLYWVARLSL